MRRMITVATALVAVACASLSAQRLGPEVKRPRMEAAADTNDALAYYNFGVAEFTRNPDAAAAAFYWAARINPAWGDPLYARRAALIMADRSLLEQVMEGNRKTLESNRMRRLDSLQLRALMWSPFLFRQFDRAIFTGYIKNMANRGTDYNSAELQYAIDAYLRSADYQTRAWLAYSDRDFPSALAHYARAMSSARDKAAVRLDRARIFSMQSNVDSATAEFNQALLEMRKKDQKDLVILYDSKALVEYSIAVLLEGKGNAAGAREAYGRALTEDLSYYPAHMRLGLLALGLKDTTVAMSELALAAQLAPNEPHIRFVNGWMLGGMGHFAESIIELRKAIELEPFYALPYLRLGQVYEQLEKAKEAADSYESYLKRASASDVQRAFAQEHLTDIKELLAATAAQAKP